MTEAPRHLLEVSHLSTSFATSRGLLRAVDDVSLTLDRGETLGVVGESGSGKSVLVRTIMNILGRNALVSDETRVIFNGRDTRALTRAESRHFWGREIAMVFQDPMTSLNPVRRIGKQIIEPIRYHLGLDEKAATERAVSLLDRVGIPEPRRRLNNYPHELSGGMRQRVTIAIAISCEPKLLVADEPTTALDVTVQKQILDLLAELQTELGMSMILITHDLGVVAAYANRIAVMYAGRMIERADAIGLFESTRHPYTEALLQSIPRIEDPSHTPLRVTSGRPPNPAALPSGCRFSPRCRYAQPKCVAEEPLLAPASANHDYACFFPVGSPENLQALAANLAAGVTSTGLALAPTEDERVEVSLEGAS
jgi:peptide/nickel transport system ATP-binding protein